MGGCSGCCQTLLQGSADISHLPFRISYCTADKMHGKVFAYIAQSQHNENLECHAFLCTKRKMVRGERLGLGQAMLKGIGSPGNPRGRWALRAPRHLSEWAVSSDQPAPPVSALALPL